MEYIERSPVPMAVTDGGAHIVRSANAAFRQLYRIRERSLASQPLADVIPEAERPAVLTLLDHVYRTGEARRDVRIEHVRVGDAGAAWWSYTVWPTSLDAQAHARGLVIQISDSVPASGDVGRQPAASAEMRSVNEQLLLSALREEALTTQAQAAERRAAFLANASAVLSSSLDLQITLQSLANLAVPFMGDWCIVYLAAEDHDVRRAAVARVNARNDELGQELEKRFPLQSIVLRVFEYGEPVLVPMIPDAECEPGHAGCEQTRNALRPRSGLAVPITVQGHTAGVITLIITESPRRYVDENVPLAQALAQHAALALVNARRMHDAEAASQAKSRFLAAMSHELRTPLTAIIGYGALLADGITGPVTGAQQDQLGRIQVSASHLLGLIDEVLTLSRVEAGRDVMQCERVDVPALLGDVATIVEPLAAEKHLALHVRGPAGPITMESDPTKLRQILVNLLGNAIKFTDHGGVTLYTSVEDDIVSFAVSDTGIGIPPEHLERIFEPFWQVEQKTTRKTAGTGLGLTVSRRLAQLLGGDLTAESAATGEGSIFTLTLPLKGGSEEGRSKI